MSLAERVAEVPEQFEYRNASTATLLKESGYLARPDDLKVADVENVLTRHQDLADRWFQRGHDQQLVGGWGLERCGGRWRVQSYGSGNAMLEKDRLHACAEFIVRYVGFIRLVLGRY